MVNKHPEGVQCCGQSPRSVYCFLELNYLAVSQKKFYIFKDTVFAQK